MVEKIFRSLNIFENFPIDMNKFRAFVRAVKIIIILIVIIMIIIFLSNCLMRTNFEMRF